MGSSVKAVPLFNLMKIPKTIVQTFKDEESMNDDMLDAVTLWQKVNPTWEHSIYYDADCRTFLKENFNSDVLDAFNKIQPGAGKGDLFRYCYLYINGGVYADVDTQCIVPLDDMLDLEQEFVSAVGFPYYGKYYDVHQTFIACQSKHKILEIAIMLTVYNIIHEVVPMKCKYHCNYSPLLRVTGTKLLADAVNIFLNKPLNSPLELSDMFPFRTIAHTHRRPLVIDKDERVVINARYEGYDPGIYWIQQPLYDK